MALDFKVLSGVAIMFLIIIVTLSMGAQIDNKLETTFKDTTITVGNESHTSVRNQTVFYLTLGHELASVAYIYNHTGYVIPSTCYDIDYNLGGIVLNDSSTVCLYSNDAAIDVNVTYDYYEKDYDFNQTTYGRESKQELSSWIPTLAIVIAAAIVLGVVIIWLSKRGVK